MAKKTVAKVEKPNRAAAKVIVKAPRAVAKAGTPKEGTAKPAKLRRKRVNFYFESEPGSQVYLVGSFSNWDPSAHPLSHQKGIGAYAVTVLLTPGRYEYKFIVDGQWVNDPHCAEKAPDGYGAQNSVVEIR